MRKTNIKLKNYSHNIEKNSKMISQYPKGGGQKYTLALDIGGTKIKTGLIKAYKILNLKTYKTEKESAKKFLNDLEKIIENQIQPGISKIGIATAGLVKGSGNNVSFVPHFPKGLIGIPLKKGWKKNLTCQSELITMLIVLFWQSKSLGLLTALKM